MVQQSVLMVNAQTQHLPVLLVCHYQTAGVPNFEGEYAVLHFLPEPVLGPLVLVHNLLQSLTLGTLSSQSTVQLVDLGIPVLNVMSRICTYIRA